MSLKRILTLLPGLIMIIVSVIDASGAVHNIDDIYISCENLYKEQLSSNRYLLIDIRAPQEFQRFHIPGSINISILSIPHKAFLKGRDIVIIGRGYECGTLFLMKRRIKRKGISAKLLYGGISMWERLNLPLTGHINDSFYLRVITPLVFKKESICNRWVVIDLSGSIREEFLIPDKGPVLSFDSSNTKDLFNKLLKKMDRLKDTKFLFILFVDRNGDTYNEIDMELLTKSFPYNYFFLDGGVYSLKRFHNLLKRAGMKGKYQKRICHTCPDGK